MEHFDAGRDADDEPRIDGDGKEVTRVAEKRLDALGNDLIVEDVGGDAVKRGGVFAPKKAEFDRHAGCLRFRPTALARDRRADYRRGSMSTQKTITLPADAQGGCLCGAVRYMVAAGDVAQSGYCHCRTCQRQSGAPVVAWFAVAPDRMRVTKGTPKTYRASARAGREFCGDCGTYLFFREDDPTETLGVNTATLDDPSLAPPTFHIWRESRIGWFETADDFPRRDGGLA